MYAKTIACIIRHRHYIEIGLLNIITVPELVEGDARMRNV
jgi:hypothetical protein